MKTAVVVSYGKSYAEVAALSIPNQVAYCQRHRYEHYTRLLAKDGMAGYPDLVLVRALLPYYSVIMRIETDALIMNPEISIESIFPSDKGQQLAAENIGGSQYNAGVLLFRNERSSYALIDELLARKSEWKSEQQNLCDLINEKSSLVERLNLVPAWVMNSYCDQGFEASYQPGDFIVHFYCRGLNYKLQQMQEFLK